MKLIDKIITIILAATILQSCAGQVNRQGGGTLIGGATGAVIGSQFGKGTGRLVGTGLGAVGGALIGGQIGKRADENHR